MYKISLIWIIAIWKANVCVSGEQCQAVIIGNDNCLSCETYNLCIGSNNLTWQEANDNENITLPEVTSQDIQDNLVALLNNTQLPVQGAWLGARLSNVADPWIWLDRDDQSSLEASFQGCYPEFYTNRDLPHNAGLDQANVTVEYCIEACGSQGYTYAGVHDGTQCYCGNTFGKYDVTYGCPSIPCSGDSNQLCGGSGKNAIYKVDGVWAEWEANQPNNYLNNQYCAALDRGDGRFTYLLADEDCDNKYAYICEKQTASTCANESGYVEVSQNNSFCFYISNTTQQWYIAKQLCSEIGGQLLTITNDARNSYIQSWLETKTELAYIWVGLQRNRWHYTNGAPVRYTNFAPDQQSGDNKYLYIDATDSFLWKAGSNTDRLPYVTKSDATPSPNSAQATSAGLGTTLIVIIAVIVALAVIIIVVIIGIVIYTKKTKKVVSYSVKIEPSKVTPS